MSNAQFYLHHYPQQEVLADLLISKLQKEGQDDPFYQSQVLVRNQGMATWLNRRLADSSHAGIAMQVKFPQPNTFLQSILHNPTIDPEVLKWKIYETLPRLIDRKHFEAVHHYLEATDDNFTQQSLKRYQLSGILSGLFDKYLLYRPDWINAWEENIRPPYLDSKATDQELWQRELWQAIHRDGGPHWSQTIQNEESFDLPDKNCQALHVFGISNFAPVYVRFLYQLSQKTPVHIYWMNPVEAEEGYWEHSPTRRDWQLAEEFDTPEILQDFNPLLSSFGRLGREFIHTIYGGSYDTFEVQGEATSFAFPSPVIPSPSTNLERLQSSIYNNLPQHEEVMPNNDSSISIHSCHTPLRELQTLKTYLLRRAESSPLDTDDVLVMCPDISTYAPAIKAVFGDQDEEGQKNLQISIRDQAAPSERPSVVALLSLFTLHTSRFTNQEALRLLSTPNILSRFNLNEHDLSTVRDWLIANGIRWGFDDDHAKQIAPNSTESPWTWRAGLDRMLLGYAMPNPDNNILWNDILPFHEIEASNAALLGSLCQFLTWCESIRNDLNSPKPLDQWVILTKEWIKAGFDSDHDRASELQILDNLLETILQQSDLVTEDLPVEVFASHLQNQLESASSSKVFLNGAVTFCEMKPMRAIPSKVLCLLGMNHDSFPRKSTEHQFDLTRNQRKMGDRSTRDDDTYSFLEAILSARENLFISFIGTSIKDGQDRPPSTTLQTLIDYVPGLSKLVVKEKLHAYDPEYFQHDAPISHDATLLAAAQVMVSSEQTAPVTHTLSISGAQEQSSIDVHTFISAINKPAAYFLKNTIHARSTYKQSPLEENEPIDVDGLTGYQIKRTFLEHRGISPQQVDIWKQEGLIPVGELGQQAVTSYLQDLEGQVEFLPETTPFPIAITINGLTITGNILIEKDSDDDVPHVVAIDPSSGKANTQLHTWICQLLVSEASKTPVDSCLYFIDKKKLKFIAFEPAEDYLSHLSNLVDLFHKIESSPIAHFPKTAEAYHSAQPKDNESPDDFEIRRIHTALSQWNPNSFTPGKEESEDDSIQCLFDTETLFNPEYNEEKNLTHQFLVHSKMIWPPLITCRHNSKELGKD